MPTPAELLALSQEKLKTANRIDGNKNSYKKDNPAEYQAVMAYLAGGLRPNATSDMGLGLVYEEDARRLLAITPSPEPEPPDPLPPEPPDPEPPVGTLLASHTYMGAQAVPPSYAWDWGFQYTGSPPGTAAIVPNGLASGLNSLKIQLPPSSGSSSGEGLEKWFTEEGQHIFVGFQFKLPSDWKHPGGWGGNLAQLYYQACVNQTWGLNLYADHVRFILLSGKQSWSGTPNLPGVGLTREYNNADGQPQGPSPRAIPVGRLTLGVWHTLISEIVASYESTGGLTRIWHKIAGEASYRKTVDVTGIPTLQWGPCNNNTWVIPKGWKGDTSHKFGLYAGNATHTRSLEHANIHIGTTFDVVAAEMK